MTKEHIYSNLRVYLEDETVPEERFGPLDLTFSGSLQGSRGPKKTN